MSPLKKSLIAVVAALGIGATGLYAQQGEVPPSGPGWGMMGGGYGPGGYGPGARGGYGPGMMGGYGPGMMGGYGPGMMRGMGPGGYGPGFGMGPGMGPGTGGGALAILDLTEAQRKQVLAIQDETRKKNWATMGVMHDEMSKLRDGLWAGDQRDRATITAANKRMFELRQQMLDNQLDAADRIEKVLTPQQRETLKKRWGPGWMIDPEE